jgi:hypothetical protein
MPTPATEERLAEIGRRIEHLETRAQAATPEAKIVAKRRVDALWKQQASARAAVRETAAGIEEELSQLGTRVDIAEQSAVADVTKTGGRSWTPSRRNCSGGTCTSSACR